MASGTAMAITMDVGEVANHHPRNKKPVGDRLGLLALNYTYGQSVQCTGPQYASFSANNNKVTVNFKAGTADGLTTAGNTPLAQHFYVAGADQVFHWASAKVVGNTILITAPAAAPLPIQAVRYAFTNAPITNLQNAAQTIFLQTGTTYLIVTLSEEGMAIVTKQSSKLLPVKAREVFDVTGAGDTVIAVVADQLVLLRDGAMVSGYLSDPSAVGPALQRGVQDILDRAS